ncbi:ubiquinol-cytochrome c reductase complex assembly factor 2 [Aspergillus lucknowensis]|uniref:Mitochondrial zinc maintenance protein 1, mitochondrial n=1 Tax=Aspergillus lucknowensis TaxID=176173 RepID=A0ABR4LM34_9EURO
MARPPTAQSRLALLLKHWPADPIRPSSVSVQTYLKSRLPASQDSTTRTTPSTISEPSLNALSSLLEDRYARRYPLSPKLRRPASNPDHYDNLLREFEEAPSRDWFGRLRKRLGGLFRFQ